MGIPFWCWQSGDARTYSFVPQGYFSKAKASLCSARSGSNCWSTISWVATKHQLPCNLTKYSHFGTGRIWVGLNKKKCRMEGILVVSIQTLVVLLVWASLIVAANHPLLFICPCAFCSQAFLLQQRRNKQTPVIWIYANDGRWDGHPLLIWNLST